MIKISKRIKDIHIRLSEKELKQLKQKAKKTNMTISEYVRQTSLDKEIIIFEGIKDFSKSLKSIDKNLDHLTNLCHQGYIKSPDIKETKGKVGEIWQYLNLLMEGTQKRQG